MKHILLFSIRDIKQWWWLAFVAILSFALLEADSLWQPADLRYVNQATWLRQCVMLFGYGVSMAVVLMIIHRNECCNTKSFWRTKPISSQALVCSKLVSIFLLLVLPYVLIQCFHLLIFHPEAELHHYWVIVVCVVSFSLAFIITIMLPVSMGWNLQSRILFVIFQPVFLFLVLLWLPSKFFVRYFEIELLYIYGLVQSWIFIAIFLFFIFSLFKKNKRLKILLMYLPILVLAGMVISWQFSKNLKKKIENVEDTQTNIFLKVDKLNKKTYQLHGLNSKHFVSLHDIEYQVYLENGEIKKFYPRVWLKNNLKRYSEKITHINSERIPYVTGLKKGNAPVATLFYQHEEYKLSDLPAKITKVEMLLTLLVKEAALGDWIQVNQTALTDYGKVYFEAVHSDTYINDVSSKLLLGYRKGLPNEHLFLSIPKRFKTYWLYRFQNNYEFVVFKSYNNAHTFLGMEWNRFYGAKSRVLKTSLKASVELPEFAALSIKTLGKTNVTIDLGAVNSLPIHWGIE